jgi:hypothetical protein
MTIPTSSSQIKSVSHITTRTSKVANNGVPYISYLKISCLEMEKARREKEKLSALARIAHIDARLAEIEAEKDAILHHLGERQASPVSGPPSGRKTSRTAGPSAPAADECFKIRY